MLAAPHPAQFIWLPVAALVVWRMYSRIRRLVGRQTFSRNRARATVLLFPALIALMLAGSPTSATGLAVMAAGVFVGVVLGILGLRLTIFDDTPTGLAYTPSAHLGVALSMLVAGRIIYRMVQLSLYGAQAASQAGFVSSPVTLGIIGCLAGYYVTYAAGLLKRAGASSAAKEGLEQPGA